MAETNTRGRKSGQTKVVDEVEGLMNQALAEASARLAGAGLRREFEQGRICFDCQCSDFLSRDPLGLDLGGGDHAFHPCLRGECGHGFFRHFIY